MEAFTFSRIPKLLFGNDRLYDLPKLVKESGCDRVGIITGGSSLKSSGILDSLIRLFQDNDILAGHFSVEHEPSPADVDAVAEACRTSGLKCIIGIGGGSVIDTAKAAAAMINMEGSVKDYLEGVGTKKHPGSRVPLLAVPTTSGTGSEATKNAVISEVGLNGFKKSLRHDNFIPDIAVLDPKLMVSCPPSVTAASGLDAITQLLESYVSSNASIFSDSLVRKALNAAGNNFELVLADGSNLKARGAMAYAAYISGISLANAGLGVVHGIAGVLGSTINIPHGTACGTLLAESSKMIIDKALSQGKIEAYRKYADAGLALMGSGEAAVYDSGDVWNNKAENSNEQISRGIDYLLERLYSWQELLEKPRLSDFGLEADAIEVVARKSGTKNTPVKLDPEDIIKILEIRF
ncbi:MAG: iron-containing alcohol dehydrogenase [Spirochaetales bacterium]|nr:iron-containing alcohol dehydrogenase [Spirochaetales bacterium]